MFAKNGDVQELAEEFTVATIVAFVLYQMAQEERGPIVKISAKSVRWMTVPEEKEKDVVLGAVRHKI